jgi:AraC family transcriptional regulator, ethanolamine operon transcriptional activator
VLEQGKLGFDQYGDSIQNAADLLYLLTAGPAEHWSHAWRTVGRISIQFGVEGGSKILHGMTRSDTIAFLIQTTGFEHGVFFHGRPISRFEVALLAPDRHFTLVTTVPVGWMAVAIPVDLLSQYAGYDDGLSRYVGSRNGVISLSQRHAGQLIELVKQAVGRESELSDIELLAGLTDIFDNSLAQRIFADESVDVVEQLMRSSLEYIRARPDERISVEGLAVESNVSERTLLRGFQRYLKMGPKQYLTIRQLNLVRRALRERSAEYRCVTDVLAEFGVTEFGRFAGRYRGLFGETPSQTLQRSQSAIGLDVAHEADALSC